MLRCVKKLELDKQTISKSRQFHKEAFRKVLDIQRVEYTGDSLLLVPLKHGKICFEPANLNSTDVSMNTVVTPKYKEKKECFFIEGFLSAWTPKSKIFGEKFIFQEYYKNKYNLEIENLVQELIKVSSVQSKLFIFCPGWEKRKNELSSSGHVELVPELFTVDNISAGLCRQIQFAPYFIYRMLSLMWADDLRSWLTRQPQSNNILNVPEQLDDINQNSNILDHHKKSVLHLTWFKRWIEFDRNQKLDQESLIQALTLSNTSSRTIRESWQLIDHRLLVTRICMA